jgi:hypothetical protein
MTTELEKNTTTTTDSPYDNYETPTTTENQFLISSTESFFTEPAENNTTTYSSSENNKTATTTTTETFSTELKTTQEGDGSQERIDEIDDTDAFSSSISGRIDHIMNELKITQRLGKKNNDNKQKKMFLKLLHVQSILLFIF